MRNLFCVWFGPQMSEQRKDCFDTLVEKSNVNVVLINDETLKDYIVEPLHEGFQYLSATHKADYLRIYLMKFHGGGYTDIKRNEFDWNPYFDQLEQSDKDFSGYAETKPTSVGYRPAAKVYQKMSGLCHFIFKKNSKIAQIWYNELMETMDKKLPQLKANPGHYHPRAITSAQNPSGIQGVDRNFDPKTKTNYPFKWTEICGTMFHKILFENQDRGLNVMPFTNTNNYR